eukprot:1146525-Pelagomonas_calceolata.AAC.2
MHKGISVQGPACIPVPSGSAPIAVYVGRVEPNHHLTAAVLRLQAYNGVWSTARLLGCSASWAVPAKQAVLCFTTQAS